MQKLKEEFSRSRTAFFEEVRTLHEAYVLSQPAPSAGEEAPADSIPRCTGVCARVYLTVLRRHICIGLYKDG